MKLPFSRPTKQRRRPRPRLPSLLDWLAAINEQTRRQVALGTLKGMALLMVAAAAVAGVTRLHSYVRAMPSSDKAVTPVWVGLPDWLPPGLTDEIAAGLPVGNGAHLLDDTLVRRVGEALAANAWISTVRRVEKFADGRLELECAFRRPVAVVYRFPHYYLLDADGVRLPGRYEGTGTLPLIQGVRAGAPPAGRVWPGEDVHAGLTLAALLGRQAYADQITGISVSNYGGREDAAESHIRVHTAPEGSRTPGGVILWGSALGQEVEEATAGEKLDILAANWRRTGRIDAGLSWIDISVGPSQFRTAEVAVGPHNPSYER